MTWKQIVPGIESVDALSLQPVKVTTPTYIYPTALLTWSALADCALIVAYKTGAIWESGQVERIEQDNQQWRITLTDGTIWFVERTRGCGCGTGDAPIPL